MTDWKEYDQEPERNEYKKSWYQDNKEEQRIKNYRAKGLNYIRNYAEKSDILEYRKALNDKLEDLKK